MNQRRDTLVRHGIIDSDRLGRQPLAVQLFFRNLLHLGDRNAVFYANPDDLRLDLYRHALDRVKRHHIQDWLHICARLGLVKLFTRSGKPYGQIISYGQRDGNRRALHPKPEADPELPLTSDPPAPRRPIKTGSEVKGEGSPPPPKKSTEDQAAHLARLQAEYPHLNIEAELREAQKRRRNIGLRWLEQHWLPNCEAAPAAASDQPQIEPEPEGWRLHLKDRYYAEEWATSAAACTWENMPRHWRAKISREMNR